MIDLDAYYIQAFVGKMVKHFTITCELCHNQMHISGQKREVAVLARRRGWFTIEGIWFCHKHDQQIAKLVIEDDERYEPCNCSKVLDHKTDCATRKSQDLSGFLADEVDKIYESPSVAPKHTLIGWLKEGL